MRYAKLTSFSRSGLMTIAAMGLCCVMAARAAAQSAEDRLLQVLASDASVADKCNACRELQTAGSEKSIPALAALLTDPAVSHTARIALQTMSSPAVDAALRDAVGKTSGLTRSGVIDSLGERRDVEAVAILAAALADDEPHVRAAAATALGKIGTPAAAEALVAAHAKARDDDRIVCGQGLARCAKRLNAAGKRDEAAAIYAQLSQPTEAQVVRMAAWRGRLRAAGAEAAQAVARALADDDPLVRQAAAGQLQNLSVAALREVAAGMSALPAEGQTATLAAIRVRQDKSLASVVLRAAGADDPAVRIAAIRALGIVGDATALPLLIESSAKGDAAGRAARQSLETICDPQVDEQIAQRLRAEKDPSRRAVWIGLVEARRPAGAVGWLLKEATNDHPEVRGRAMAALANLAGPKDVAAMASAVLHADRGAERDNAEKAVMLVCQRIPDAEGQAAPVIGVFKESAPADQAALLPLLGRIGGPQAKEEVEAALSSSDAARYEAGVRAICNWPDASVAGELLELSEKAESATHRLWALRAFIRVIALPNAMPDAQKLVLLKQAMQRAERDEERNLVLQRVSAVRTVEALRFLLPYLDQPSLVQTAGKSITELGRHTELREANRSEFIPALEKVIATNQDHATLEQARRYLQAAQTPASP
ncbi:MAG: HEAT repeat domain-containing protein [Pirellulales bacterium]|nr:HEAT repeat domain-containing protein [Pirellulales bacterium]